MNLQKKRFGLCVKMSNPISASTFTSEIYRRMQLQSDGEVHPRILQSDSPGISNNSAAALPEVLTDVATTVRRDGRHLAPIFPSDEVAKIATQLAGWINQSLTWWRFASAMRFPLRQSCHPKL